MGYFDPRALGYKILQNGVVEKDGKRFQLIVRELEEKDELKLWEIYHKGFYMQGLDMSDAYLEALAHDAKFTFTVDKIFQCMLHHMGYGNIVMISTPEICEKMSVDKFQVSKALKILKEKGWIKKVEFPGKKFTYEICIKFALKGSTKQVRKSNAGELYYISEKDLEGIVREQNNIIYKKFKKL